MEKQISTTCTRDCPDCCSILVTLKNGKITKHRANPANDYTRSFLCSKGNNYLKRHSSPNRLLGPMVRTGDDFKPVSWDDALDLIAEKLSSTRQESGPLSSLWAQYSGSLSFLNL
ncbi:MAG: molybdopterin-dependent oxidoreductase, partial [bacterium]|nr:molybdopterin-dependent oxidoreductase [bacterium]